MKVNLLSIQFLYKNDEDIGFEFSLGIGSELPKIDIDINYICDEIFTSFHAEMEEFKDKSVEIVEERLCWYKRELERGSAKQRMDGLPFTECMYMAVSILMLLAHGKMDNDEYNGTQGSWMDKESGTLCHGIDFIQGYESNNILN